MLRAIIVDDEELSVKWLKSVLAEVGGVDVCETFMSPLAAYEYAKTHPIRIAFLDISMPAINGMRLSSLLRELDASIEVVFVTAYDDFAVRAFELSALDYLMKPVTAERLAKTLERIGRKQSGSEAEAVGPQAANYKHKELLTGQELKILQLVAGGLSNKEIADRLYISGETVKSHIKSVYRKLGIHSRLQALRRAEQWKLLE